MGSLKDFARFKKSYKTPVMDSAGTPLSSSIGREIPHTSDPPISLTRANEQPVIGSILPQHVFHHGAQTVAGFSRFPTMKGHTHIVLSSTDHGLFSLNIDNYMRAMLEVKYVAGILLEYYGVARCALVANGDNILSIIPLQGLGKDWKQMISSKKEYHEHFPGYISSMDGPQMDASHLQDICACIQKVSGISPNHNFRFDGDQSDQNLFARIVRGEVPQSRAWEDEQHVAFLTPFANTPGFTVLVPRTHLSSDIFSLEAKEYSSLVRSAYSVAQVLKSSLGLRRCGMIFEGFEIDYAHIKLIPIHEEGELPAFDNPMHQAVYEENYTGCVTSLNGPLTNDLDSISSDTMNIRKTVETPTS